MPDLGRSAGRAALKEVDGFDILVSGVPRTFRDREDMAITAAQQLAGKKGNDPVQVRTRATGKIVTVTAAGTIARPVEK